MLSRQCEIRIDQIKQGLSAAKLKEVQETLEEVQELCEIDEEFDRVSLCNFSSSLANVVEPLKNELSIANIIQVRGKCYTYSLVLLIIFYFPTLSPFHFYFGVS